jgi:hypothetical protein
VANSYGVVCYQDFLDQEPHDSLALDHIQRLIARILNPCRFSSTTSSTSRPLSTSGPPLNPESGPG